PAASTVRLYYVTVGGCVTESGESAGFRRRESVINRSGGHAMHPLDILFWTCLMLGGAYTLLTLLMGGFSHAAGHLGHVGGAVHIPHAGHLGDLAGHHHAGHIDAGGTGHAHAGHAGHVAHGDAGGHGHDA